MVVIIVDVNAVDVNAVYRLVAHYAGYMLSKVVKDSCVKLCLPQIFSDCDRN